MGGYLRFDESIAVDDLRHYGVLGMKWGVRNAETRARYARGKSGVHKGLTDKQKTALKVAAGVAAVAAVGGLAYAGYRAGAFKALGKSRVDAVLTQKLLPETASHPFEESLPRIQGTSSIEEHLKKSNPLFGSLGHGDNCTSCSAALELRMRGYDVEAVAMTEGKTMSDIAKAYHGAKPESAFLKIFGEEAKRCELEPDPEKRNELIVALLKKHPAKALRMMAKTTETGEKTYKSLSKMPDGARGYFIGAHVEGGGSHCMYWTKDGGRLRLFDGQSGEEYRDARFVISQQYQMPQYLRTDNLTINWDEMSRHVRAHNPYYDALPSKKTFSVNKRVTALGNPGFESELFYKLRKAEDL